MANPAPDLPSLVGQAPAFLDLMEQVSRVAPLDRPVLVIGERGTGKELIAARLHYLSSRWDRPLLKLNAAALPETLLDSELFGHEAGAFTGAIRQRRGRFELADGGSLFLDEIASTSLALQERLLRVVEYGAFERVGGSATVQVDVRLIGATNVDLPAAAADGRFRYDLLDRLAFDVLTVPPLRARREDVTLLAEDFGRAMALELGWPSFPGFGREAQGALLAHAWPGNVRELKNVVERAVYRAASPRRPITRIEFDPFASPFRPGPSVAGPALAAPEPAAGADPPEAICPGHDGAIDFRRAVAAFERRLLEQTLLRNRHNQRTTAAQLNLTYDQLRHQLRKHRLLPDRR
ncbi:MAG: phage shock protein operon transcriptional activator [Geminicoccaceae bacterium]